MNGLGLSEEVGVFLAGGLRGGQPLAGGGSGGCGVVDADHHGVAFVEQACGGEGDLERNAEDRVGGIKFEGGFHAVYFGLVHAEARACVEDGLAGGGAWLEDDHGMLCPAVQDVVLKVHVPLQLQVLRLDGLVVAQGVLVLLIRGTAGIDGRSGGGGGGRGGGGSGCVGFTFRHAVSACAGKARDWHGPVGGGEG